jgi:hypothetical protein
MIDMTLSELLTGLDLSDEALPVYAIALPKFVRTGAPVETDASFRKRVSEVPTINRQQIATACGYELDAIGALDGLIRDGLRLDETPVVTPKLGKKKPNE